MEYSKSEIRELKNLIEEDINKLEHYTTLYIPDPETGLADLCIADFAVTELDAHLKCMKKHIIDTDNYGLAVEIEGKVTPVWGKYVEKVTNEDEIQRLRTMPGHLHFSSIRETMLDWLNWLDEYEAEHPQQPTPTESPSGDNKRKTATIKNYKILKALPDLYNCLVDEKVIDGNAISNEDFGNNIVKGIIPKLSQNDPHDWVKKIAKFKEFIRCIKQCFSEDWYNEVCKSANLTPTKMGRYSTDNTADFEPTLRNILKQNGIK